MSLTGGYPGAERVDYTGREWTPGDPIWVRPRSHAQGNHVRTIIQLIRLPNDDYCCCSDKASWPEPMHAHDLSKPAHIPRTEWSGDAA